MRDAIGTKPAAEAADGAPARTITLTPAAVDHIKRLLAKEGAGGRALRIGVKAGGCSGFSYFLGFTSDRKAQDIVLEYDGLSVYVDPRSMEVLDGTVVDYQRGLLGAGIQFRNPRAKKTCGCGDSFTV